MKKITPLLFFTSLAMLVASCSPVDPDANKATIALGEVSHATTTLSAGKYELNKEIKFTVTVLEEYKLVDVRMNDNVLTPINELSYSFTPTEVKTYTLTVNTENNMNEVVFNFATGESLHRKGIKLDVNSRNVGKEEEIKIENGKMILENGLSLGVLSRATTETETYNCWMRKITFVFDEGEEYFIPDESEKDRYKNGVWQDTENTRTDRGIAVLFLKATGHRVVLNKIIVESVEFKAYTSNVSFTGIDTDEKIYVLNGLTQIDYDNKVLFTTDMKFPIMETAYFLIERNARHKKYYEFPDLAAQAGVPDIVAVDATFEDKDHNPIITKVYCLSVPDMTVTTNISITASWIGKNAYQAIKVDDTSGIKYVKGYMETNALTSIGVNVGDVNYGGRVTLRGLRSKTGYHDLKVFVNGSEVPIDNSSEVPSYSFIVPEADEIKLSFSALQGEDIPHGATKIPLGEKGYLLGGEYDGKMMFKFENDLDHPTAKIDVLKFNNEVLTPVTVEESQAYILSAAQKEIYDKAEDKVALFNATIIEGGAFATTLRFNKGAYSLKIERSTDGTNYTVVEPSSSAINLEYNLSGNDIVRATFTPQENLLMYALERNDKRLTKGVDYETLDNETVIYNFTATREEFDFLIQTDNQKVLLNVDITFGYKVEGLPTEATPVGQSLKLTVTGVDDDHPIYGKKVTVTYNGKDVPFSTEEYSFVIIPVKGAFTITVVVSNA